MKEKEGSKKRVNKYSNVRDVSEIKYYDISPENPIILKLKRSENKKLYHYTNDAGAKGILNSKCFWVTQYNFLDDNTEIRYMSLVLDCVIKYLYESKYLYDIGIKGQEYVLDTIIKVLEAQRMLYKNGAPITDGNLFVFSLTENKNNEYLFKNYCKGNGAIFEIENQIDEVFKNNNYITTNFQAKVEYDLQKQMVFLIEDINEFYSSLLDNLVKVKDIDYLEMVETIKTSICFRLICYSLFFKHEKYMREEEYRVVFLVGENYFNDFVKYRIKSDRKIPYIEVKIDSNFLPKIIKY